MPPGRSRARDAKQCFYVVIVRVRLKRALALPTLRERDAPVIKLCTRAQALDLRPACGVRWVALTLGHAFRSAAPYLAAPARSSLARLPLVTGGLFCCQSRNHDL